MNTTNTKIAGEAAMTDKMQANDRPMYIFLGPGDVIRATDERYSSTYHKWKPIAPLYVGSTVDASTRPVRRRALLASKDAVPEGWKLVPVEPTQEQINSGYFGHNNIDVYRRMLAAAPTALAQSDTCPHRIVDARNKVVKSGYLCIDCGAVFAAVHTSDAPAQSCGDAEQADEADFKNFHRLLCERFGYVHDDADWKRDQLSLIEHISAKQSDEALTLTASQREKLEQLADVRFTRPLDGWDKSVLRKLLERTSVQEEPGRTLTEEQFEELQEAREILENMVSSVEADGNYSTEATCTFLRQALQCLPRIDAARAKDSK